MKKTIAFLVLLGPLLTASDVSARTITLTSADCDEMAVVCALGPKLSWAVTFGSNDVFTTHQHLQWRTDLAVLMRFPVDTLIPPGQRITKAELTLAPHYIGGKPAVQIHRLLAAWGVGVSHQHRMTFPKKLEWAQPGGRGAAVDRAAKESAKLNVYPAGEHTADVTEDIELWYTGAATNRGWIMTLDDGIAYIQSPYSPQYAGEKMWKLQITFEPK